MFRSAFPKPFSNPFPSEGAAAIPWYLSGGIVAANCIAVYQPKGAASLAASYVSLHSETHNLTLGSAPSWNTSTGWTFNGSSHYLKTDIIPTIDQANSMIVRFSGASTETGELTGVVTPGGQYYLKPYRAAGSPIVANGGLVASGSFAWGSGVMAVAGNKGYRDGSAMTGTCSAWTVGPPTHSVWIGCRNNGGVANNYTNATIVAVAFYRTVLSAVQVLALTNAMNAL